MMLLELKKYLMQHKVVNLQELALHFDEDPDVIQDMLEHWIRKGRLIKKSAHPDCDTCMVGCTGGIEQLSLYQWQFATED